MDEETIEITRKPGGGMQYVRAGRDDMTKNGLTPHAPSKETDVDSRPAMKPIKTCIYS